MIDPASPDWTLSLLTQAARFAEKRQTVLAGNVANIGTPNYKTRDLPVDGFRKAMSEAVARGQSPTISLGSPTPPAGDDALFSQDLFKADTAGRSHLTFQDGGNRNLEQEATEMTKNAMQHRMAVEMLTSRIQLLETVISGRL
jgi:flagellar basal-body rod protein FlgB